MTSPSTVTDEWLHQDHERLLSIARATGANYADLFAETSIREQRSVRVRLDARGRLLSPQYRNVVHRTSGAAIRAFGPGCHVLVWCGSPCSGEMRDAARQVADRFRRGTSVGAFPLNGTAHSPSASADRWIDAGAPQHLFERLTDAAFSAHPGVIGIQAVLRSSWRGIAVFEPGGASSTERTTADLQLRILVEQDGQLWRGYAFGGSTLDEPESLAVSAVERAQRRAEARPFRSGRMPVVIGPGWGGIWLHEAAGHAMEADRPPAEARTRFVSPLVSIVDDGRIEGGRASAETDDEGVATQRTQLIRAGVRIGHLTDRYHAQTLTLPLTGNGRRQDYRYLPLPRMSNIVLEAGESDPAGLVGEVSDGLYVSEFSRGQYFPERDRLQLSVRGGRHIVQGRLQEPVEPLEIAARPQELLTLVSGVGNDLEVEFGRGTCRKHGQNVSVSVGAPTVLFASLDVQTAR